VGAGPFVDASDVLGAVVLPAELAGADELAGALLLPPGTVIVTPALAQKD